MQWEVKDYKLLRDILNIEDLLCLQSSANETLPTFTQYGMMWELH